MPLSFTKLLAFPLFGPVTPERGRTVSDETRVVFVEMPLKLTTRRAQVKRVLALIELYSRA